MHNKTIQARLEKTLAHYVAMPTIPNDVIACSAAIKALAHEFGTLGMTTHIDGLEHPWLIATSRPGSYAKKHVKVLFVIHFDVVPFANEGQLAMRATPGKLYGRGVYDMKFAAAVCKELMTTLAANGNLADHDVGVLITTDEEMGGYDGAYDFLQKGWRCDVAIVPDGGWNWSIEARAKGLVYIYLQANGRAAHSSRPWTGDNPIPKLTSALTEIASHFPNTDPNHVTASINSIEASNGAPPNTTQIPEWAKAGISIRAFSAAELAGAQAFIEDIAKKYGLTTHVTLGDSPVHLMRENLLVQQFIGAASSVLGRPIPFTDALAASDARHFAKYSIPTILMYPNGGDHHGPEEWVERRDLFTYYQVCEAFLQRVAP